MSSLHFAWMCICWLRLLQQCRTSTKLQAVKNNKPLNSYHTEKIIKTVLLSRFFPAMICLNNMTHEYEELIWFRHNHEFWCVWTIFNLTNAYTSIHFLNWLTYIGSRGAWSQSQWTLLVGCQSNAVHISHTHTEIYSHTMDNFKFPIRLQHIYWDWRRNPGVPW